MKDENKKQSTEGKTKNKVWLIRKYITFSLVLNFLDIRKIKDGKIIKNKLQRAYRRMPWYMAPKKDVTSCEKLWGAANEPRSADIRMRELTISNVMVR